VVSLIYNDCDIETPYNYGAILIDYGLGKRTDKPTTQRRYGPLLATAPEILRGERFETPADVYSYGILLWDLTKLWMRERATDSVPELLIDIITECLWPNPKDRRLMSEVKDMLNERLRFDLVLHVERIDFISREKATEKVLTILGEQVESVKEAMLSDSFISLSIDHW